MCEFILRNLKVMVSDIPASTFFIKHLQTSLHEAEMSWFIECLRLVLCHQDTAWKIYIDLQLMVTSGSFPGILSQHTRSFLVCKDGSSTCAQHPAPPTQLNKVELQTCCPHPLRRNEAESNAQDIQDLGTPVHFCVRTWCEWSISKDVRQLACAGQLPQLATIG